MLSLGVGQVPYFSIYPGQLMTFRFHKKEECVFFFQKILTLGVSQGRRGEWAWLEA